MLLFLALPQPPPPPPPLRDGRPHVGAPRGLHTACGTNADADAIACCWSWRTPQATTPVCSRGGLWRGVSGGRSLFNRIGMRWHARLAMYQCTGGSKKKEERRSKRTSPKTLKETEETSCESLDNMG